MSPETDVQLLPVRDAKARGGNAVTTALGIVIFGMIALTVLPAEQRSARTPAQAALAPAQAALAPQDYIEIQQLVRKYAWALDGGDNYGYAYADLFTPDGVFVGMNQGPGGRSYQGRDQLAALARGGTRGPTQQSHFAMNLVITPTRDGATGREIG